MYANPFFSELTIASLFEFSTTFFAELLENSCQCSIWTESSLFPPKKIPQLYIKKIHQSRVLIDVQDLQGKGERI